MIEKLGSDSRTTPASEFSEITKQFERALLAQKKPATVQAGEVATRRFFSDLRDLRDEKILP